MKNTPYQARFLHLPWSACLVLLVSSIGGGCNQKEKEVEPVVSVQVTPAQRETISQIVSAEAVVYPLEQAVIAPKITSTIKTFLVQRGSRVQKGQLLAILENADLTAAVEQSKGEYEQAQASYVTSKEASLPQQLQKAELDAAAAKVAFEAQQKVYESRMELFRQGALPRRDLDAASVALAQARSQNEQAQRQLDDLRRVGKEAALKSAAGQLAAAQGKYLAAQAQLRYSEIRSPISGVVTDRPLFPGELATANQPLLTVMNTSRLIAKAHIPQSQAALLKAGDPVELEIQGAAKTIAGRVTLVSPALDLGSTTVEIWAEASRSSTLKAGTTVQLSITAATVKDAVVVPQQALFHTAELGDYVVVAGADGLAHTKPVETGIRSSGRIQIRNGISPGDAVIISGAYALPDHTKVKLEAAQPAGDSTNDAGKNSGPPAKKE